MERLVIDTVREPGLAETIWREMCRDSEHSYYLSWGWVSTWLDVMREMGAPADLVVGLDRTKRPVLAFMLGQQRPVRHHVFRNHAVYLNASGIPELDQIAIEFNAVLCRRADCSFSDLLSLIPGKWDEFELPGLDRTGFPGRQLGTAPAWLKAVIKRDTPAYYVELGPIANRDDYLALLGKSTRASVRQTLRGYQESGPVRLESAQTLDQARDYFDEMVELHRNAWDRKGICSNFLVAQVLAFHRNLIGARFGHGEIQLLRVRAGKQTIGVLYNLVYRGKVYNYQSGFRFEADNRYRPGLLCHVEAVVHNATACAGSYEFLAGDAQYKRSLGTRTRRLTWVRLQKPSLSHWLEHTLGEMKRRLIRYARPPSETVRRR